MQEKREPWSPLRIGLLALVLLAALWFTLFGVFELANIAAICCFLLLALAIWRWPACREWLRRLWRKRGGRVMLIAACVIVALLVIWIAALCVRVIAGMRQPESDAETVIVLGCQVRGEEPCPLLAHRIDAAADYLKAHPQAVCIASGGRGSGENITEAACIYRCLVARGIDPSRILCEEQATTTWENLRYSKALIEEHGLPKHVVLVSSNYHLYRALEQAGKLGLDADGLPASCAWYLLPPYILREALALIKFRVFG